MENQDYYAFLESICDDKSGAFTIEDKIEAEAELQDYYQCLAELEFAIDNDELSDDERETAYAEWLELTDSEPMTA
jgi:hypothetical protein